MNSGIQVSDEVLSAYKDTAMKRKSRYVVYKPSEDGTAVEIEKVGERDETFDDFKNSIPVDDAR